MGKFKVGDIITGTKDSDSVYMITNSKGKYEVIEILEDGIMNIKILEHEDIDYCHWMTRTNTKVRCKYFEMVKSISRLIYVCSPYSGDIDSNTIKAQSYSRYVVDQGHFPIPPHLLLPQFMDEETEREKAMELNYKLLDKVDELWVFGEDTTEGMLDEISYATTKGIPITDYTDVDFEYATGGYVDYDRFHITEKGEMFLDKLENKLGRIIPDYDSKKITRHMEICEELNKTYKSKNGDYGDSFGISYKKYGKISSLTRLSDKFNRIENILLGHEPAVSDETIIDTLTDLANYAIMTRMELELEKKEGEKYCEEID